MYFRHLQIQILASSPDSFVIEASLGLSLNYDIVPKTKNKIYPFISEVSNLSSTHLRFVGRPSVTGSAYKSTQGSLSLLVLLHRT